MKFQDLAYHMAIDYFVTNLQIEKPDADKDALDKHAFELESKIIMMGPNGSAIFITAFAAIIQCFRQGLEEWNGNNMEYIDDLCVSLRKKIARNNEM